MTNETLKSEIIEIINTNVTEYKLNFLSNSFRVPVIEPDVLGNIVADNYTKRLYHNTNELATTLQDSLDKSIVDDFDIPTHTHIAATRRFVHSEIRKVITKLNREKLMGFNWIKDLVLENNITDDNVYQSINSILTESDNQFPNEINYDIALSLIKLYKLNR